MIKRILGSMSAAGTTLMVAVSPAFAQQVQIKPKTTEFQPLQNLTIPGIISGLISLVLIIAALVFFFMLVIGGIRWMLSGGDKTGTEGARNQVTAALIGLIIVFSAWAIIQLIKTLFGVDILGGLTIPSFQGQ